MKAKPRWMKSVIETAAKYAHSVCEQDKYSAKKSAARSDVTDQA